MYCYFNNGMSMRAVDAGYSPQHGEIIFPDYATPQQLSVAFSNYTLLTSQENIKFQIVQLELTVTPRRLREAVLGVDGGWLANINTQIAALRAQLTTP